MTTILEEFRLQARFCLDFGSSFTSQLLDRAADDIAAGGVTAGLTASWTGHPRTDAVSLRFAGALHAAVLTGRAPDLAARYPGTVDDGAMEAVWPLAEVFLKRDEAWVRQFMTSPPQTNETGRAAGLAAGFMSLAESAPGPFHLLELGASAGLNLNWDKFSYAYEPWGRRHFGGPLIPTVVTGELPPWRDLAIASRTACDLNPIDPASAEGKLRLRAYVWADQSARMDRLNAAIDLAITSGLKVEKADAAAWAREKLTGELPPGLTAIYHSVFYQYPPRDVRIAISDAIEQAGRRASADRQLAWVRFEPERVLGAASGSARYVLNIVRWDGAGRHEQTLADVDPHGRFMSWAG